MVEVPPTYKALKEALDSEKSKMQLRLQDLISSMNLVINIYDKMLEPLQPKPYNAPNDKP